MSLAYKQNNISIYTNGEQCFIYFGGDVGERLKEFTERKNKCNGTGNGTGKNEKVQEN